MEHSRGWVQKYIYNLFIFYEPEYFVICFGNQDEHFTWCLLKPAHIKQKETEPTPAHIPLLLLLLMLTPGNTILSF